MAESIDFFFLRNNLKGYLVLEKIIRREKGGDFMEIFFFFCIIYFILRLVSVGFDVI